ncbi:histidine kinase dimerization/phospho-acceptor domain-containing protein [Actinomadura rubrisoli]|uniref:histidine kinase dimerization/phospho-acceptor domain-containing protein n=1 Tax=Actinomadura rubrisoli TaxID=2530368 RepID=UPI001A9CC99A|nr:histidine kinase dimerization/phospho-acceptor domain-containing protein [Actinomadura rubrisoli]
MLERSLAARRQLVADASHELRTPLTALRTNIDILGYGDRITPRQRERAVTTLDGQLRSATGLANDLVELARLWQRSRLPSWRTCAWTSWCSPPWRPPRQLAAHRLRSRDG